MHKETKSARAELLTKQQVAEILQMSVRSVYRKAMDGEIPHLSKSVA